MFLNGLLQPGQHVRRTKGPIHPQHMALPGVFVENRQYAQYSAAHSGVSNEVPRPHMPTMRGGRRQTRRNPTPNELSPARRNTQSFRTPETLNVSLARPPTFLAQQSRDPAISKVTAGCCGLSCA